MVGEEVQMSEENISSTVKFFLTHAELQTIKGFQDKLMMASNSALMTSSSKQLSDSLTAQYKDAL